MGKKDDLTKLEQIMSETHKIMERIEAKEKLAKALKGRKNVPYK